MHFVWTEPIQSCVADRHMTTLAATHYVHDCMDLVQGKCIEAIFIPSFCEWHVDLEILSYPTTCVDSYRGLLDTLH